MFGDYDQIIAIDYAQDNVAIARLTQKAKKAKVLEGEMGIKEIRLYLKKLPGRKSLTIEETTTAQWLYCELRDSVDRIYVCDPFHNRLLSSGAKNDKIDAVKLAELTRAGLIREVYHTTDELIRLRKLVSAYEDVIEAGVRMKNQKSAVYRQAGRSYKKKEEIGERESEFVLFHIDQALECNEKIRLEYEKEFQKKLRGDVRLRRLIKIPGIGIKGAIKILATVVDAQRFEKSGKYLAYSGLVLHEKESGGRSYGTRRPRFSRRLKSVYKTAALSAIGGNNDVSEYFQYLRKKGLAEHNARHAIARYIAVASYGVLKSETSYKPFKWRKNIEKAQKET